ncbi:YaiO family outer membrane beta-barrel protein [Aurantibacter sp.]|uniref:YaiO family outer membrane beta-barrel protein n=1 Tax=Aurantibacter sp. TaxID=2807103 RepID=UPI003267DC78
MSKHVLLVLILFMAVLPISAQEVAYNGNPDRSFLIARGLAFEGHRTTARDTLYRILSKYPDYSDVRNLLASTYSWDGNYETARAHFNKITSEDRQNKEAWVAAIKNELYADNYYLAYSLSNKALQYLKNDIIIKELQSKALSDLKNAQAIKSEKAIIAKQIDTVAPQVAKNRIGMGLALEVFDVVFDPMIYSHIEYRRETQAGTIIPRINYSNRFETHGVQYELDFYPKFSKKAYGYLNYGYSNSPIYPLHRAGAELYLNWPKNVELSAGMRHLSFTGATANIITGSIGLYKGNYFFSLRPYVTPITSESQSKIGLSGSLLARKYFRDGDNYLGLNAIYGYSPELKQLRSDDVLLAESLLYIESQQLLIEYQFSSKKDTNNIYKSNFGITRQELAFDSGNYYWSLSAGLTCQVKF